MSKWDRFFNDKIRRIFIEKRRVLDIGGGLRISKERGNRYNQKNAWIAELANASNYKILDTVETYHPDIVGDIQNLPLKDNSQEAIICSSVLTHVENPHRASEEMHRVLKSGGYCFVYVPFLYYYHAEEGYYKDYWRFTEDSIRHIFKKFSSIEIQKLHGATETWLKLSPLGRFSIFLFLARVADIMLRKTNSKQTSGFYVFLVK
ncbi:methyltransferase domain-containing protein [Candidatus Kaiserbacteria bacterium]|nr:methyltransferase domain-containing protein [Candidatus Kaiserbacteria bacterium]